ncbi:MAG: hypothetical protein NTU41_00790 [Chloroflexi bacterium]|nr:hypothetical protein [Chloroflexota bacterium]
MANVGLLHRRKESFLMRDSSDASVVLDPDQKFTAIGVGEGNQNLTNIPADLFWRPLQWHHAHKHS